MCYDISFLDEGSIFMTDFDPGQYWEDRLRKNFSLSGVGDHSRGKRYNEWLYRVRKYIFPRLMKKLDMDITRASVLDIGSGTGFYIERWKEMRAAKITGADITSVVVETLAKKFDDFEFVQMDIGQNEIPLAGQQFDIISCFDVLFHIVDDEKFATAIRNIYSLLKPGGILVFSDNFLHGSSVRARHQVSRSLEEIETIVRGAGFQVSGRYPMFVIMAYPIDSHNRAAIFLWRAAFKIGTLNAVFAFLWGALLYPIELLLLNITRESPTTEMMICIKRV
jgi:SAM-dependent methyltransferase